MKIKIDKDVIVYEEEEEIILVNMMKNKFYALDGFGSFIWKKINELKDIARLIDFISDKYQEDKAVITRDVKEFIYNLEKVGLIKVYE